MRIGHGYDVHRFGSGDEIVLGGAYPLMLATSSDSQRMQGGHFHGDGAFHEGEDH